MMPVKEYYAKCGIVPGGFSFTKMNESSVFKKFKELKSNKATGLDNIPVKYSILRTQLNVLLLW